MATLDMNNNMENLTVDVKELESKTPMELLALAQALKQQSAVNNKELVSQVCKVLEQKLALCPVVKIVDEPVLAYNYYWRDGLK
mmetsp:Transcript_3373/g.7379  ORF Transcript_3373/g.7379 Transcript_3373/m.7379 type:complete len:84 (-) Transcript_3373:653-904(-)